MDIEIDITEYKELILNYREAYFFPIASILNTEKDTAKAMSKIAQLEISQIVQNGYGRLTEVEEWFRSTVCEVLNKQEVDKARNKSKVIVPVDWLINELIDETSSIISLVGNYIEMCIEANGIIKNNSGLSGLLNSLFNNPANTLLSLFGESSTQTSLKKLGIRLDTVNQQLNIQLNSTLEKIKTLISDKLNLEVEDLLVQ